MGASELYLVAEISGAGSEADDDRLAAALQSALAAAPIASVLLMPTPGISLAPRTAKRLVELIQGRTAAALIADDASLARTLKADGVHLTWSKDQLARYGEARDILGTRFIVGADAGRSRDDAMSLGEEGADYVAFGIPPHVEDRETAFERQCELVDWWSEIFEPPCVAFDVASAEAAEQLAAAHADFVALSISAADSPEDAAGKVKTFTAALKAAEVVA